MVYDEGFDITFEESQKEKINFFAFSKYSKNQNYKGIKSKWASHCYSTLIGWFYIGNRHGCFYATKNNVDHNMVTNGEAENKLNVLENSVTSKSDSETNNENNELDESKTFSTVNIFFEKNQNEESVEPDILENIQNEGNFLESSSRNKITLTAKFKDHFMFVNKLNSMNTSWKAENYENFSNLTVEELNRIAGRKRASKRNSFFKGRNILFGKEKMSDEFEMDMDSNVEKNFLESSVKKLYNGMKGNVDSNINNNRLKANVNVNKKDEIILPTQFLDYKNYMAEPRSQVKKIDIKKNLITYYTLNKNKN